MTEHTPPAVLFICSGNGGKSQMAAAAMRQLAGDTVIVHSGGTRPKEAVNSLSAAVMAEVGADISAEVPKGIDPAVLTSADRVIVLGTEARVDPVEGMRAPAIETWETDEPSHRGIDGEDRMRLVRDDITARVEALLRELRRS